MKKKPLFSIFLLIFSFVSILQAQDSILPKEESVPTPTVQTVVPNTPVEAPAYKHPFEIKVDDKEDHFMKEFLNMLSTLGLIVAVLLLASWFLKKMTNSRIQQLNTSSLIKIVEQRNLTPKTVIYLLDIKGEGVIIGESVNGLTQLGHFDVNTVPSKNSFETVMNQAENKNI